MSLALNTLYRFEEFELTPSRRVLTRKGKPISVSPKAFEVLTYLVRHPGRVVTKEEILSAVWPGSFVEEGNLAQQISGLRKALTDKADYIVTLPGRGYQFTAAVQEEMLERPATHNPMPDSQSEFLVQRVRERTRVVVEESSAGAVSAGRRGSTKWIVMTGVLVAATFAAWLWWHRMHLPVPGDHHEIVVADFDNQTGEEVFDVVLKNALEIDLEQSPLLALLPISQTRATLQEMGQSPDAHLNLALAREVCERNGAQAALSGSIAKLGNSYVITMDATECVSGKQLVKLQSQAKSREAVLQALGEISSKMRSKLGESLRSIHGFDVPIQQATTQSLDALVAYSKGSGGSMPSAEQAPFYERAIQLDPRFAMAYDALGRAYGNAADMTQAKQAFAKAYELRQPTSAREQFVITAHYDEVVQDDLDSAANNYVLWTSSYPEDAVAWGSLANTYTQMGRYPEAIAAGLRSHALSPNSVFGYVVLARAYKRASEFAQVKALCNEALSKGKDSWHLHSLLFQVAAAEHDAVAMAHEAAWDKGKSTETQTLDNAAFAAATAGRLIDAERYFSESEEAARRDGLADNVVAIEADRAEMERLLGAQDRAHATAIAVPTSLDETSFIAAINAAQSGSTAYTERVIEQFSKTAPQSSTLVQKVRIPLLQAAVALHDGKPERAITLLQPAKIYEFRDYYVPSLLGAAYLENHQAAEAAAEYQEILANPGIDPLSPALPLAHLGLGRAYAAEKKTADSRKEYESLFALWKDADADLPVIRQARLEYAKLAH
jgi:DNA-binding winged helix-turn-helix (wHTH) protein/tetratricopeptide (TPR) repeat protein